MTSTSVVPVGPVEPVEGTVGGPPAVSDSPQQKRQKTSIDLAKLSCVCVRGCNKWGVVVKDEVLNVPADGTIERRQTIAWLDSYGLRAYAAQNGLEINRKGSGVWPENTMLKDQRQCVDLDKADGEPDEAHEPQQPPRTRSRLSPKHGCR